MTGPLRPRASRYGQHAAISTGHPLATRAAALQLERGGSLVDAMIAASAVLTVALPHATSLGGCGMLLFHDAASGRIQALNGSGCAPARATPAQFGAAIDARGPRSWITPGLVRLWAQAHRRHGRLPWAGLLDSAIALAADGTPFANELARNLQLATPAVREQPGFAAAFQEGGQDRPAGVPWRQPALGDTLSRIAAQGEAGFYQGPVARALCEFSHATGGLIQADDLTRSHADWGDSVQQDYGRFSTAVMPPNSVGPLMLAQLQTLRPTFGQPREARLLAQILRARQLLPGLHDRIADPGARWPWQADEHSGAAGAARHGEPGDTAGIVMVDRQGNGLVMLQSVFQPFGSGCVDPATGVLMNNRLSEFSLDPARHNCLAPGRRPVHTLNPYIVSCRGRPVLFAVSPGGVSQTTTGVQCISNTLIDGWRLPDAIDAPRWSIARNGEVMCEPGFSRAVREGLHDAGVHVVADSLHPFYFGSIKAVQRLPHGVLEAAADLRREADALAW